MMNEAQWQEAIRRNPAAYTLPAYGPWMTTERAAAMFARWAHDEATGRLSPALCPRCGVVLRFTDRPHQQLHVWCDPALHPAPASPQPEQSQHDVHPIPTPTDSRRS